MKMLLLRIIKKLNVSHNRYEIEHEIDEAIKWQIMVSPNNKIFIFKGFKVGNIYILVYMLLLYMILIKINYM